MNKNLQQRYNIIFIILLFVIPLLALDFSFYFIEKINYEWDKKEQEAKALQEVETLSIEADFTNEFSSIFKDFFEQLKSIVEIDTKNKSFITNQIIINSNIFFEKSFSDYKLYIFKIDSQTQHTDLLFYKDNKLKVKRMLCNAFEHLFKLNESENEVYSKIRTNESSAKALLGDYLNTETIAKEMRGTTTNANGIHKNSWFIWNYYISKNMDVYGAILISNEVNKYKEKGRLIALEKLKSRHQATGAFIPLYKEFGEPDYLPPLDKSDKFKEWAKELTIQNEKDLEHWLEKPLPQGVPLGKYTAYCHLGKASSHIAVVLVKSLNRFFIPKWLIAINIISISALLILLYCGICFKSWLQISLRTRFALSYLLASILPLGLLSATAYGYLIQKENTAIDQDTTELQTAIKSFEAQKLASIKEYKTVFTKAINDETLISLIKNKGILDPDVTNRVIDIFEKNPQKELPLLGVKIFDENGNGALSKGTFETDIDVKLLINSFQSTQINLLITQINAENKGLIKLDKYEGNAENDLANRGYKAIMGRDLDNDLNAYFSVPIKRKNGEFCCYQIFDFIKIDGKTKYMLFVVWDDKALDEKIIQKAFDNQYFINKKQNFLAYRSKGKNSGFFCLKNNRSSRNIIDLIEKKVELAAIENKSENFVDKDKIIVIRPALNFNNTIFIGWIDKFNIFIDVLKRKTNFIILAFISLFILLICSIRSTSVFLKPVSVLKKALDEVSSGNLNITLDNAPKDELGLLTNEFSEMIEDLKEKERLSKLISDQAVQAIQEKSDGLLKKTDTFKGVALVSDIRNFTGMSEKNDPRVITDLLNEHFAEMTKIISDNGGHIYKFIGDAIEAVFPEKAELEKSASERAFTAACMMISKLAVINKRRESKDLFTYRIGVGLCYGTMYSGSVGSMETRLDYAILGEPLKNAAKFEALSIQNKEFPIVLDEYIAEKIASLGYELKKLDSQNLSFSIYSLNNNSYEKATNLYFDYEAKNKKIVKNEPNNENNNKVFSLGKTSLIPESKKLSWLICTATLLLAIFIIIGFNEVFSTTKISLKAESEKECSRLIEQLKNEEVLKSAFERLCFLFYKDVNEVLYSKNSLSKDDFEKIIKKYETLGCPIPQYYCSYFTDNNILDSNLYTNGFSDKARNSIEKYAIAWKEHPKSLIKEGQTRISNLKEIMKGALRDDDMVTIYYRRSSLTTIEDEDIYIDTNKLFNFKTGNYVGYLFCGIPKKYNKTPLENYYTLLSGNNLLLAIKNKNGWYFSNNFSQEEKNYLIDNPKANLLKEKGYKKEAIEINNEPCTIYAIKKDLIDNNNSIISRAYFILLPLILVFSFIIIYLKKKRLLSTPTVATKLKIDILLSSILPIITVIFVSYLYVNEDFNVKKSEVRNKLNKLMDDVEEREYYYNPLCETFIKDIASSGFIKHFASLANKEQDNENKKFIANFIRREIDKYCKDGDRLIEGIDPHFNIREIVIVGKNNWVASEVTRRDYQKDYDPETGLSPFGKLLIDLAKVVYFKSYNSSPKPSGAEIKSKEVVEKLLETFKSIFGNTFSIKLANFPNNLNYVTVTYSTVGVYIATVYSDKDNQDLEYVLFALIFFDNELKPRICNIRNDKHPIKNYIASGAVEDSLYSFYSPNIEVGRYFFYDGLSKSKNIMNEREDFDTVKELGFVSSWINTSYLPVSISTELHGKHLIEARQGNKISDNVYAAMASEYPIKKNAFSNLYIFVSIIILSIIMIYLIVQTIINDLLLPIKRLIEGAKSVEKGDYKFRTEFYRKDELGALCDSFDKMLKGLEEKQLMSKMVSQTALSVSSNYLDTTSKKVDVLLLYISIPEFDKIMRNTSADDLFPLLSKQIAMISEIILKAGGDIDKIMGEKLLIAFHIKDNNFNEVAITASKIAKIIATNDKLCFKVSVGVNCGQVISGYLGVGEKRDFTIIGDPVNVTARIESLAEKLDDNRCLISQTLYQQISEHINAKLYGEVELKGKSLPMKVYRLL